MKEVILYTPFLADLGIIPMYHLVVVAGNIKHNITKHH